MLTEHQPPETRNQRTPSDKHHEHQPPEAHNQRTPTDIMSVSLSVSLFVSLCLFSVSLFVSWLEDEGVSFHGVLGFWGEGKGAERSAVIFVGFRREGWGVARAGGGGS